MSLFDGHYHMNDFWHRMKTKTYGMKPEELAESYRKWERKNRLYRWLKTYENVVLIAMIAEAAIGVLVGCVAGLMESDFMFGWVVGLMTWFICAFLYSLSSDSICRRIDYGNEVLHDDMDPLCELYNNRLFKPDQDSPIIELIYELNNDIRSKMDLIDDKQTSNAILGSYLKATEPAVDIVGPDDDYYLDYDEYRKMKERVLEDNHIPLKLRMLDEQVNMSLALQSIH